jgi:hypothetical protein
MQNLTDTQRSIVADYQFCMAERGEFVVRGGFSLTCLLRTVAALNVEATRRDFLTALGSVGLNENTCRTQFAKSRAISVADGEGALQADGSIVLH